MSGEDGVVGPRARNQEGVTLLHRNRAEQLVAMLGDQG